MSDSPKASGSLIVLRDGKVLMLKRNKNLVFSLAHSFPGGKVESKDREVAKSKLEEINASHGEFYSSANYPSMLVAALRETEEETGLVLRRGESAEGVFAFIKPFIRFVTPYQGKKRFDSQFFVVELGEGVRGVDVNNAKDKYNLDELKINKSENMEFTWEHPQRVLEQYLDKKVKLFPPTIYTLFLLCRIGSMKDYIHKQAQNGWNWLTFPLQFDIKRIPLKDNNGMYYANEVFYGDHAFNIKDIIRHESSQELIKQLEGLPNLSSKGMLLRSFVKYSKDFRLVNMEFAASDELEHPFGLLKGQLILNGKLCENNSKL